VTLAPGVFLGPYQVANVLGAGGMGEVYRATDTKLERDVALKLLPAAFGTDGDRLARFEREAKVLASLNHPGIAHLYAFEQATLADGRVAHLIVMELVEGEDLAERLQRGAIPVEEAISIARQIAEALEAAHEKGIVHRDLKPANVKLTANGTVKVLDFGLARAWSSDPDAGTSGADLSKSPTLAHSGTAAGLILGTAAYMSPEQARGKTIDKRADIWAFGVVLFEMLAGRRLFDGETVTDVLAAVVKEPVDWTALPAGTPAGVRRVLRRCLDRDPRQRLHDIADARLEIAEAIQPGASPEDRKPRPPSSRWVVGAMAAALLGWAATGILLWPRPRLAAPVVRFEIPAVANTTLGLADRPAVDVSADGRRVVFAARADGTSRLYLRDRSDVVPRAIPGTEGASNPVFSPSGTSIAFFGANALKVVTLDGAVSTLAPAMGGDPRGLSWAGTDRIIFAPNAIGPLMAISASGGAISTVSKVELAGGERSHRWPHVLPGAQAVLFTVGTFGSPDNYDDSKIEAVVLATGERRTVLAGARIARYVPASGHLLFARGSTVYAVPFDPRSLTAQGEPAVLLREVDGDTTTGASHFACADDGTFVYVPGSSQAGLRKISWLSRDGTAEDVPLPAALFNDIRIAPDGQRFAVAMGSNGRFDIWVYAYARKTFTRLTFDGHSATPEWSADNRMVYYASLAEGGVSTTFQRKPADGSREAEALGTVKGRAYLAGLEGGERSAFVNLYGDQRSNFGIFRVAFGASGEQLEPTPIMDTPAVEYAARLSPDRRWLAFQSSAGGTEEVYVRDLAGTGAQWQVTTTGGEEPNWSSDGRELFYRFDRRLMVVPVESRGRFNAGPARLLLDGVYNLRSDTGISYDVAPGGDRLLMIRPAEGGAQAAGVRVVLNMFDELARAMKADR
jgi:eukaryotic-like serine/threonine-protein kinase